ncbi:xanthine dehydrogenase small subunit [Crenobacter intestini]|uniref:Xanthine dehydrogenase small subunit n=1 Tax=Crenobacter intestini TaxID=2563443 RepID=A0A4T0V5T4_9NEIS|nr:xanthine dehydrogenase small subunit [Crenobacter intestini]TIC87124.1 xanthine dehydrogenase small subunit [Crenobacter intestini]
MDRTRSAVRFLLDGKTVEVTQWTATTMLLPVLREQLGRTGSKEGCAEGDCGACMVLVGREHRGRVRYQSVNACIRPLALVDGCEVVTVESLAATGAPLHPVQQALVQHHASQCGFCTPGITMALAGCYLEEERPDREKILSCLSGNLCRCTGYRPVIDAALSMDNYPPAESWNKHCGQDPERLAAIRALDDGTTLVQDTAGERFAAPRTQTALAQWLALHPDATLVGGATDLGVAVNKAFRKPQLMLSTAHVQGLDEMHADAGTISIGAAVSLSDALTELAGHYPALAELKERFASPPIRHAATLAGNLANGSPVGDTLPPLLVLDAELTLVSPKETRRIPLHGFYTGYRQTGLRLGEYISAIHIPRPRPHQRIAAYKLARRFDQDISTVSMALSADLQEGCLSRVRLAFGGMAACALRLPALESALEGQALDKIDPARMDALLERALAPLSDHRGSAGYRQAAAQGLLRRALLQWQGAGACRIEDLEPTA